MKKFAIGVLLPAAISSAISAGICAAVAGSEGLYGALVGAALVAAFFLSSLLVLGPTKSISPTATMIIALLLYGAKVVALVVFMVFLFQPSGIGEKLDRESLAGTVVALTLVWTVLEIRAATKSRQLLYDLSDDDS